MTLASNDIQNIQSTILIATGRGNSVSAEITQSHVNRMAYLPYGYPSAHQQPASRLGFNGELREQQTCWYFLGNGYRVYNPVLMRFHSPVNLSPFGVGGVNSYMYCVGDPINYLDPTGHIRIGSLLFRHLKTPVGALMATSVIAGVGGGVVQASDPGSSLGTALLMMSVAAGLGAGYLGFVKRPQIRLTGLLKKDALSNRPSSPLPRPDDGPPSYASLFPNAKSSDAPIIGVSAPARDSRNIIEINKLQKTTASPRKVYWPEVSGPGVRRQTINVGGQANPIPRGITIRRAAENVPDGVAPAQRRRRTNLYLEI